MTTPSLELDDPPARADAVNARSGHRPVIALAPKPAPRETEVAERDRISYRDAAIIEAAGEAGAPVLYGEGPESGRRSGATQVIKPFREAIQ
ncbi:MAG: hypothetical protein RQ833_11980 [Sphingomonadaceae bacterium]|nr:hypothetical protein [Sphingomonadaceae bacterium]